MDQNVNNQPISFRIANDPSFLNDVLLATIHNVNVLKAERSQLGGGKAFLGLVRGMKSWARNRGAVEVHFNVSSGINLATSHRLAKRMGFQFIGGNYVYSNG